MESNKENVWFFVKDSQQQGPVCLFEIRKLLEQRVLSGDTFVWNKSMNNWQMAKSLDPFTDSIFESTRIHLLPDKFNQKKNMKMHLIPVEDPMYATLLDFSTYPYFP